jgi:GT2 family glycosyltransferase/glycosyltransferase involved in cell wall biosynthesis
MVSSPQYEHQLARTGAQVVTQSDRYRYPSDYISDRGSEFGVFYLIRYEVAEPLLELLRAVSPNAKIIFHTADLHFLRESREAELSNEEPRRIAAARTRDREVAVMRRADLTVLQSPAEVPFVRAYLPAGNVSVFTALYIPVIQDSPSFAQRANLFFLGGFSHTPNVDAVLWFVREVWPLVRSEIPELQFHIVGAEAPTSVRDLGKIEGIKIVGYVQDLAPVLSTYRIGIVPLRYGAGIKGKLAMTMGAGVPCVSTRIAAEGMGIEPGVHAEVADDPAQFARAIVDLYLDANHWAALSEKGKALVEDNFSDDANLAALISVLNDARVLPLDLLREYAAKTATRPFRTIQPAESVDVSVIVPVYNNWQLTRNCLNSIHATTFGSKARFEVILADDCSSDETCRAEELFPGLRLIRTEKNLGFLRNCNNAATQARGRYLLFLNNDTIVLPGWLSTLVELLEEDPSIAISGSKLLYPDGKIQEAGAVLFRDGTAKNLGRGMLRDTPLFNVERETDYISGASILVRRTFWDSVGGFDERYQNAYCEDSDLAMTARSVGLRVVYQPKSEVIHLEHQTYAEQAPGRTSSIQPCNIEILVAKWRGCLGAHHLPNHEWAPALANAERHATARALARRSSGRVNILYFTPFPSHPITHGNRSTINEFARWLQNAGHRVHFVLLDSQEFNDRDAEEMRAAWNTFDVLAYHNPMVANGRPIPFDGWYEEGLGEQIQMLCAKYEIDVVICSYVFQSKLLEFVPSHVLKVVDTHDKMGNRYEMLQQKGLAPEFFSCSPEEEGQYLRRADIVIARRAEEARYFDQVVGRPTSMVIAHFEAAHPPRPVASRVNRVGIVASANKINLEMLKNCIEAIDRHLGGGPSPFVVRVAGQVKDMVDRLPTQEAAVFRRSWIELLGFVPNIEEFYASVDVVLSPVMVGTGINVKTVQAMAFGMPVLATRDGSKGIETAEDLHAHRDVDDLVSSLFSICDEADVLARLAAVSRERYAQFYTVSASAFRSIFDHPKLLGGPRSDTSY